MKIWTSIAAAVAIVSSSFAQPIPTEKHIVNETLHGVDVPDPYRWLEGDEQGKVTPRVAEWTDAQNAATRKVLDNLPGRAKLEARLRELMEVTTVSAPAMRGNRYFHSKREGSQNQAVLYVREGHAGKSRVLLDPNTLDKSGLVTLAWYAPNDDGTLLAYGTYRAGDEKPVLRAMEVDTGKDLGALIAGRVNGVQWRPDSKGFVYHRLGDVNNPYSGQIRYHQLGRDPAADPILFEQYKTGPLATTGGPSASVSRDARWLLLSYHVSAKANDLWAVDLDRWFRTGEFVKVDIVVGADANSGGVILGDTLYMLTTLDAPNRRCVAVDLNHPEKSRWRDVIPERRDAVLDDVDMARGILVATYGQRATTQVRLFDLDGSNGRELALPNIGSARVVTRDDRTEAYLTFSSFNYPPTIFRVDLATQTREVWEQAKVPVDPESVEVKQVTYASKDGTNVTMFVVHKKGMKLDGNNPTLLTGYGGFGLGQSPRFSATDFVWFDAGGVLAIPNLRGGDEYGETWHAGGMLGKKQNVFDDFIAAGEWLIASKYTSKEKLAIGGGSNGGLLVGAALTQRPDLFAAVYCGVPLLDMVRYHRFLMARYWVPEYGSAENAEQFAYLLKYSPYHNIKAGVKYPAVMFTAGENDARVHPLHARKMAAALQASSPAKPVLLWVDREAGHGGGKPLSLRLRDEADRRIFLMWQLGMLKE